MERRPVDALAYIDAYDEEARRAVQALVQQELQSMRREGITAERYMKQEEEEQLPRLSSPLLQQEMQRVAAQRPMDRLDASRYSLAPPDGQMQEDVQAWRKAISQVKSTAAHQSNRLLNLQLMDAHVAQSWLVHNKQLDGLQKNIQHHADAVRSETEQTNLKRKTMQEQVHPQLYNAHQAAYQVQAKCGELQAACSSLEDEVKRLRTEAERRGVLPIDQQST